MRGFRNIAVHQYFAVDTAVVWQIASDAVPALERRLLEILRVEFPDIAKQYDRVDLEDDPSRHESD